MTRDEREVEKAYAPAVFNVIFHNRDDHPKNFAWRLGRDRRWRLAPAFDLTFSQGPMGKHHLDVCGEGAAIERQHLLRLAKEGGVSTKHAQEVIDRMLLQATSLDGRFERVQIRHSSAQEIISTIDACRRRVER